MEAAFVLAPVLLVGCADGFDHHVLQQRLGDAALQSPDAAISEVRELKPQLRLPCRIAVYLKPSSDHDWRWTPEDKAAMELWAAALKQDGIAADVFTLPEVLVGKGEKTDLKDLRLAAARCGADVLFVVHGAAQTDSYKNFAAVFNITVVGGYVVPGSHKDSLFLMEGVLLDVDNGYIYTGVQAEGVGKIMRPTFVIEERDAVTLAKTRAVFQFGEQTLKRMRVARHRARARLRRARGQADAGAGQGGADHHRRDQLRRRPGHSFADRFRFGCAAPRPLVPDTSNKGCTAGLARRPAPSRRTATERSPHPRRCGRRDDRHHGAAAQSVGGSSHDNRPFGFACRAA